jgi:hypothetical protein
MPADECRCNQSYLFRFEWAVGARRGKPEILLANQGQVGEDRLQDRSAKNGRYMKYFQWAEPVPRP